MTLRSSGQLTALPLKVMSVPECIHANKLPLTHYLIVWDLFALEIQVFCKLKHVDF